MMEFNKLREVRGKVNPAEMKLAKQVIESLAIWRRSGFKDEYQEGLRAIIDAITAARRSSRPTKSKRPKVVDLMEALRRSLEIGRKQPETTKADQGVAIKKVTNIKSAAKSAAETQGWLGSVMAERKRWGSCRPEKLTKTRSWPMPWPSDRFIRSGGAGRQTPG